jgi:hypothetical protein
LPSPRPRLIGAGNRRAAALLELKRQRFDVLDVHLIADLHLRKVLHLWRRPRDPGRQRPARSAV